MSTSQNTEEPSADMIEMYRLNRLMGIPQVEVAERFQVSQPSVSKYLRRVEEYLRWEQREEVRLFRTRITSRLEHLYTESIQAWERSKAPQIVKTTKIENGSDSSLQPSGEPQAATTNSTTIRETPQNGEVGFMRIAMESLGHIETIWRAEMDAAERQGELRACGKTRLELIDQQLEKLRGMKERLLKEQPRNQLLSIERIETRS